MLRALRQRDVLTMPGRVDFDARSRDSDHLSVAHSASSTQGTTTASLSSRIASLAIDHASVDLDDPKQASTAGSTHSAHQARARSLAGFSEEAECELDDDSQSGASGAHNGDEEEEEEEVVEMTEQELLRLLDAQAPSLQVLSACCVACTVCTLPEAVGLHRVCPGTHTCWLKHWHAAQAASGRCPYA